MLKLTATMMNELFTLWLCRNVTMTFLHDLMPQCHVTCVSLPTKLWFTVTEPLGNLLVVKEWECFR